MASSLLVAVINNAGLAKVGVLETVEARLAEEGFETIEKKVLAPTAAQIPFASPQEIAAYTRGPVAALLLRLPGKDAAAAFRSIQEELEFTYGSGSEWEALRDRLALFPVAQNLAVRERVVAVVKSAEVAKALLAESGAVLLERRENDATGETSLLLEGPEAIDQLTLLAGPSDGALAARAAPGSLAARFGPDAVRVSSELGSWSPLAAEQLLVVTSADKADEVAFQLSGAGFRQVARRALHLSPAGAEALGLPSWLSGNDEAFLLEKPSAAATFRRSGMDAVAGASSSATVIRSVFPSVARPGIPDPEQVREAVLLPGRGSLNEALVGGLTHLCRTKPVGLAAVRALATWLMENNPNKPRISLPADAISEAGDAVVASNEESDTEEEDEKDKVAPATSSKEGASPAIISKSASEASKAAAAGEESTKAEGEEVLMAM